MNTKEKLEIINNSLKDSYYLLSLDLESCNHGTSGTPYFKTEEQRQEYFVDFKEVYDEYERILKDKGEGICMKTLQYVWDKSSRVWKPMLKMIPTIKTGTTPEL